MFIFHSVSLPNPAATSLIITICFWSDIMRQFWDELDVWFYCSLCSHVAFLFHKMFCFRSLTFPLQVHKVPPGLSVSASEEQATFGEVYHRWTHHFCPAAPRKTTTGKHHLAIMLSKYLTLIGFGFFESMFLKESKQCVACLLQFASFLQSKTNK